MKAELKGVLVVLAAILVLAIAAMAAWFLMEPSDLVIQGEVEVTQVQVASKITGRIGTLDVHKGDPVRRGQLIATIESPEIKAKLRQVEAARTAAAAMREKARKGAREEEVRTAMNVWMKAKAATDLSVKTSGRLQRLHQDGIVPAQKLDEAEEQREMAQRAENAARATYEMAVAGTRKEDVMSAGAFLEQASGAVDEVGAYIDETRFASPIDGEIAEIIPERGELITPGYPVALILHLADPWVTFNVREDFLANITIGTVFDARFPALGNKKVRLRVNYISKLGDFAVWRATKASGDFDLRTFEVRAIPDEPVHGLRPGMSALVNWKKASSSGASQGK